MSKFDSMAVSWEKIASFILDKIPIRQIVLLKAKNDYGATSINLTSVKCLKKVLEELMDELSKISVEAVEEPFEPPRKVANIIQPVPIHNPSLKISKLTPKIPIIESEKSMSVKTVKEPLEPPKKAAKITKPVLVHDPKTKSQTVKSEESIYIKQEPPEESEQIFSDFTNFPKSSPSTSKFENKSQENVKAKIEPKDELQCKESIEIKDELVNLDNSKLMLDYQACPK